MRKVKIITGFLVLSMAVFSSVIVKAQTQDSTKYRIETKDGNRFTGTIVNQNSLQIVFKSNNFGQITILKHNIESIRELDPKRIKFDGYWFDNPAATHYLFGMNALGLKSGEGYYQNTWVFFNNLHVGIADRFSLGVGFVPTFLLGVSSLPAWLMPKVSIPLANDNLHLAAGGLFGGVIGYDNTGFGYSYGMLSVGKTDRNISLGLGYGYADGDWARNPLISLSGMVRIEQKIYLITENYFFSAGDENSGLISVAIRWAPENFAVDFGLVRPAESLGFAGIPWLGVTLPF